MPAHSTSPRAAVVPQVSRSAIAWAPPRLHPRCNVLSVREASLSTDIAVIAPPPPCQPTPPPPCLHRVAGAHAASPSASPLVLALQRNEIYKLIPKGQFTGHVE
ncbi:hypothetical protein U9M48_027447 [Paspalum notatum var. saurae]|uniref:Uncharacterized protein n=1 Tax=Paspalum notatum var. saurae TaxID=547442 RepID=A0AAQ3TYV7_PASNO